MSNDLSYSELLKDFMATVDYRKKFSKPVAIKSRQLTEVSILELIKEYHNLDRRYVANLHRANVERYPLEGYMEDYVSKCEIWYSRELNICERRFVVTKELCQILIDRYYEDTSSVDADEVLVSCSEMMTSNWFNKSPITVSEKMAISFAQELLVPWFEMDEIRERSKEEDVKKIAMDYRSPSAIIQQKLESSYDDIYKLLKF